MEERHNGQKDNKHTMERKATNTHWTERQQTHSGHKKIEIKKTKKLNRQTQHLMDRKTANKQWTERQKSTQ